MKKGSMKQISEIMPAVSQSLSSLSVAQTPQVDSDKVQNTYSCKSCNKTWQVFTKAFHAGNYTSECSDCAKIRRTERFNHHCPPLYQRTDVERLPRAQLADAMKWQYGPRGLILLGETGKGKTRVAWTLLKRLLIDDNPERSFVWFDAISFGHKISIHYREEDAESWLDRVAQCPLIFFDDLGKLKLTERAEVELFGVIERRCAAELPIIVTTNDTGDSLAARMTDNRGPAMIRRLREFCEPIQFT